jgi:hypothetical protein
MFTQFFGIVLVQLYFSQISFCVRFGHEVGRTSMDSTHYDRRILQQQCSINNQIKEQHQATYWITVRSLSSSSTNNTSANNSISFRKQLIINNGEDRLVTRASSGTINVDTTDPLGIDQASLNIIVDKQVRITQ